MPVDLYLTGLADGYETLCEAEGELPRTWRPALLETYARQQAAFAERQAREAPLRTLSLVMFGILALTLATGIFFGKQLGTLRLLLIGIGAMGCALLMLYWTLNDTAEAHKPQHPLRSPLRERLFPDLYPRWRERLAGAYPEDETDHGLQGEIAFAQALETHFGDQGFVLHRVQQTYGDDVDVLWAGPQGIWVFEVKYWSGAIQWRENRWFRTQVHHDTGGEEVIEHPDVRQGPDEQWRRMANNVARTLRRHAPILTQQFPALLDVRGGVVFTCENATYDIPKNAPFYWGTIEEWMWILAKTPPIENLETGDLLKVIDALLKRHQDVTEVRPSASMADFAKQLIAHTEADLQMWSVQR
ncbi:MAG: NERD domain-containing protein [Anaerolineae bacterium]|nr:NERD domain-containing protein [Anaerolineae bacterium]